MLYARPHFWLKPDCPAALEELVWKEATGFPLTSTKLWVQVKTCCKNQNQGEGVILLFYLHPLFPEVHNNTQQASVWLSEPEGEEKTAKVKFGDIKELQNDQRQVG